MKSYVLVTGGLGYIGSHTAVALHEQGMDLVLVDDLSNANPQMWSNLCELTQKELIWERLDLADYMQCKKLFERYHFNGVIHFAAFKAVGESVEEPLKYYHNNLSSLLNVMKCMKNFGVLAMIFSSSCTVYGDVLEQPLTENHPLIEAKSPYGSTKLMAENILKDCAEKEGLAITALRYFNPIGAHPSALIGEWSTGVPNNLVPFITQAAIGMRDELVVFGNDYPTSDGTCVRDYIHVCDLAEAHVVALKALLDKKQPGFDCYNVGTGKGLSVLELIEAFEQYCEVKVPYRIGARREGDVVMAYADTQKIEKTLGWKAQRNIKDMLLSAWKWQQKLKP